MERKIKNLCTFVGVLLAALLLHSCTSTVHMATDERLEASAYKVKGASTDMISQKISFDNYKSSKIKRSVWKSTGGPVGLIETFVVDFNKTKQTISFKLNDGLSHNSEVHCLDLSHSRNYKVGNDPNSLLNIGLEMATIGSKGNDHVYKAVLFLDNDSQPWTLEIDNQKFYKPGTSYYGLLKQGNTIYKILPVQKFKESHVKVGTIGVEIHNAKDEPVAAVSKLDNPIVYFNTKNEDERFMLANACAAILVQSVK